MDSSKEHNTEVRNAWKTLLEVLIPQFAKEWDRIFIENDTRKLKYFSQNLPSYLHRAGALLLISLCSILVDVVLLGMNIRLMGYVRSHAKNEVFRAALLVEMIARCVKKEFEALLRSEMKTLGLPGEVSSAFYLATFLVVDLRPTRSPIASQFVAITIS